jgi:hypothetical protein
LRSSGNFTNRNGGAGAGGKVVVSMAYTAGTCLTTNGTYNAILDNGCANGQYSTVGLVQSGLPTTLGTAAGNARLVSVELIVAGTYNSDLNITLTSPAGTTLNMVLGRFGSGDNLGNPGTCTPLVLVDGATALNNTAASNVTGDRAPEQALSGFTGDPNGTWTVSFCDNANNDDHFIRMARLNFCTVPLITATSSNSPVCAGNTLSLGVTATGTGPLSYTWTGAGTYSPDNTTDNVTVTGPATEQLQHRREQHLRKHQCQRGGDREPRAQRDHQLHGFALLQHRWNRQRDPYRNGRRRLFEHGRPQHQCRHRRS